MGAATIHDDYQFEVANGTIDPSSAPGLFARPNLPPPDPSLGDRMRNRNWAKRDAEVFYQMSHTPQPWEFSHNQPHPRFGGGSGDPRTQYSPPPGPPRGFAARRAPTRYSFAGASPRMVRPTYAYNRVAGHLNRVPTMYAWPAQYSPGGSNTYIPTWEATGLLIKFTREQTRFRINRYMKELKVPKDQGYYLTLNGEDPYRVVSLNDYRWEDSADAPGGRQERQGFAFVAYRTARLCFPFSLGRKSVQQAEWPVVAEHGLMAACKAMTVRTMQMTTVATTVGNWSGSFGTNTSAATGAWTTSSTANLYIKTNIDTGMIQIERASGGIVTDEEALMFVINPVIARGIGRSEEYRSYIQGSPDALSALTDWRNPMRKYSLAPQLYGLGLVVENAVRVTTPKSGNVPTQPSQTRSYIWPDANAMIASKPEGIVADGEQTLDFSTIAARFFEQMTTETKSDPDNRREVGRVVEDYVIVHQAPQTGYLFTGVS